ncbi:MAG: ABC transporter permease [Verrucomicrobiales bacterium]
MRAYFIRRLLLIPPTLIGVTLLVFILTRFVPGGPVESLLAQMRRASADGSARGGQVGQQQALSGEQIEQLKEFYNLDDTNYLRAYAKWLGVWPTAIGRKKLDFPVDQSSQPIRTALTRERLVIHRDASGGLRLVTANGGDPGPWRVRSLGNKEPPPSPPPDAAKANPPPTPPALERVEIYQNRFTGVLTGNLGYSTRYQDSVVGMIRERLPISAYYGLMTMIITYLIAIPLGLLKALRHNRPFDNITSVAVFAGYAIPAFALGALLVIWLAVRLDWFPAGGFTSHDFADKNPLAKIWDILHHSALPIFCYTIGSFAFLTMMMKNQLMDNLSADYIRTAVAKGLPFDQAVRRHALRNAFIPIATTLSRLVTLLVAGSFLIERVFDINGFGLLFFESAVDRDYPVVMGAILLSALLIMLGNIVSDIAVALVDPRVKFS